MNKDSLLETLNFNKAKLTFEDIKAIMDEELNKDPDEMDTDLVDLCMDALEEAAAKAHSDENEETLKPSGEGGKKVFKLTRALLIAAIVAVFFGIAIPVSAGYINANKIDSPDNIIDTSLYGAVQKTLSSEFSATLGISHTEWFDVEFAWSISNGSVHIDSEELSNGIRVYTIEGNTSEVILIYTEYLGGGSSYTPEYYDYYFYLCDLTKNKIIPLFGNPLNTYLNFNSVQIAPDNGGVLLNDTYNDSTLGEAYYFDGKDLFDISELIGIRIEFSKIAINASIYGNYIVVLADDHLNMYEPKQSVYFIDIVDMSVINGASDIPRYLYYHQENGIIPCGGIYAYRYNEEDMIDIVDLRDGNIIPTIVKGEKNKEAGTFFYNGHMLYFDKSGTLQIIDLENGNILSTIKTGFDFSGEWSFNLVDNDGLCYLLITTNSGETYSYNLDEDVSSLLLAKKKTALFDRTVKGTWYNDGKFYEFRGGAFQETETNNFSAAVEVNGEKQKIEFIWSVANEKLRYACYEGELPKGFSLNEIEGNDTALLLSHSMGSNSYEYFICDLANSMIKPLFENVLGKYEVNDVTLSPDLKSIVFNANNGNDGYYYNGKKIYNVFDLFKKDFEKHWNDTSVELVEFKKIKGYFVDQYIVLYFQMKYNSPKYQRSGESYTYSVIDTDTMNTIQILGYFEKYDGYSPMFTGGLYGVTYEYNSIMPITLQEEQENWDTVELEFTASQEYTQYFKGYLVLYGEEGLVQIVDPAKKEVVSTIKTGINFNSLTMPKTRVVQDGDNVYMLIPDGTESFAVFKLNIPV